MENTQETIKSRLKRISCPVCGCKLLRLEPFEDEDLDYNYWCTICDIDIQISVNSKISIEKEND